jgi:6-phosphogluconate dehydrogenase
MGARLLNARHEVVAYDVNEAALDRARKLGAAIARDHKSLIAQLGARPVVWLMVPSKFAGDEVQALLKFLPAGSIIIDGGNSDYRKTLQRYSRCLEKQVELVDVGTSGGILGLNKGFSMMVGGTKEACTYVEPIIKTLASSEGYRYFGATGTGHYIKMVHNAIEYGVMESYAEGYRLLREGPFRDIDLAGVAQVWQRGSIIASNLNGLAGDILAKDPKLTQTDGIVAETGEADWAAEVADGLDIDMPSLKAAIAVRKSSEKGNVTFATRLLAALRHAFGGHAERKIQKENHNG